MFYALSVYARWEVKQMNPINGQNTIGRKCIGLGDSLIGHTSLPLISVNHEG